MAGKISALDYAFAVGRVRALENYLISYQVFQEAAEAGTSDQALEVISDAGNFGEDLLAVKDAEELDKVLLKEKMSLDSTLGELFLEKELYHYYLAGDNPAEMVQQLNSCQNIFIKDYFKLRLDLANLKLFLRCRYLELPRSRFEENFLPGGRLEKKTLVENYESSLEELYQNFAQSHYIELWKLGTEFLASNESFVILEREIENLSLNYLQQAKRITFGPEPLLAYGLAKSHELKLVRIVLAGKFLQLPVSILKERISQTYV